MSLFWGTIQVVLGIILPFAVVIIVIALIYLMIGVFEYRKTIKEYKIEEFKTQSPFDDDAEFYKVPNPTMVGVILKKDGEVIWRGAIDKKGNL